MSEESRDTLAASRAAHDTHAQLVEESAASRQAQPEATTVNADDLSWLLKMQSSSLDDSGQRRYETDAKFRGRLEAARTKVLGGGDIADLRAGTERVLNGEPATEPERELVPPQGTPEQRAEKEVAAHFEAGEIVEHSDVDSPTVWQELTAGYEIADILPKGFGISAEASEQLHAAKLAGVSNRQVRVIVEELIAAQQ